jgi:hypothetical protein
MKKLVYYGPVKVLIFYLDNVHIGYLQSHIQEEQLDKVR